MNEIGSVVYDEKEVRRKHHMLKNKSTYNAAKELLKNGILVETSKGLVCMSLKDALDNGVGGHSLSVEDFQTVATELLFQEEPKEVNEHEEASLWTDNTGTSKNILKQMKTNFCKKGDTNKFPLPSSMPGGFNDSSGNIEEFKDIHESLLEFSSLEYSLIEKITKESKESSSGKDDKILIGFDLSTSKNVGEKNKRPLRNEKNLIISNSKQPVISVQNLIKKISNKNESVCNNSRKKIIGLESVLISSSSAIKDDQLFNENYVSCEETSDNSEVISVVTDKLENKPAKKRGGWPKGRKRKPEVKHEIRPPKAPATGYVLFLNERRKEHRDMPFTEVTKLLGNEWSRLSLQEKQVYLDRAEVEKKRYREELRLYRQSDAYQTYLNKKRLRLQGNGTEESDMDATDEIDEEDNEELYCRSCDQWFHSLHNKKEHLYGRQHLQLIAGRCSKTSDPDWCNANMSSTSLDESSLDGSSYLKVIKEHCCIKDREVLNMDEAMVRFMVINKEREEERKVLQKKLEESKAKNQALSMDLQQLNETASSLTCMMESERTSQILLEQRLFNLLNVPTLFYLPEPLSEENE